MTYQSARTGRFSLQALFDEPEPKAQEALEAIQVTKVVSLVPRPTQTQAQHKQPQEVQVHIPGDFAQAA